MRALIGLHNGIFSAISTITGPWLLPTLMRFTFAATLLQYFWHSAQIKLDGGLFSLSFGAYAQVLPVKYEALGYDPDLLSIFDKVVLPTRRGPPTKTIFFCKSFIICLSIYLILSILNHSPL